MDKVKVFEIVINAEDQDESGVDFIALVDQPAIMKNWMAFNSQEPKMQFKALDEEKRLVMGAAMIPDLKIFRNSPERGDYYVYFSSDTIRDINHKFFRNNFNNNVNIMHDQEAQAHGVYTVGSFITDSKMGIVDPVGFDNPEGTWYVIMKVDDDNIWDNFIKENVFNGFSVEGLFNEIEHDEVKEDKILDGIEQLLKDNEFIKTV